MTEFHAETETGKKVNRIGILVKTAYRFELDGDESVAFRKDPATFARQYLERHGYKVNGIEITPTQLQGIKTAQVDDERSGAGRPVQLRPTGTIRSGLAIQSGNTSRKGIAGSR